MAVKAKFSPVFIISDNVEQSQHLPAKDLLFPWRHIKGERYRRVFTGNGKVNFYAIHPRQAKIDINNENIWL